MSTSNAGRPPTQQQAGNGNDDGDQNDGMNTVARARLILDHYNAFRPEIIAYANRYHNVTMVMMTGVTLVTAAIIGAYATGRLNSMPQPGQPEQEVIHERVPEEALQQQVQAAFAPGDIHDVAIAVGSTVVNRWRSDKLTRFCSDKLTFWLKGSF